MKYWCSMLCYSNLQYISLKYMFLQWYSLPLSEFILNSVRLLCFHFLLNLPKLLHLFYILYWWMLSFCYTVIKLSHIVINIMNWNFHLLYESVALFRFTTVEHGVALPYTLAIQCNLLVIFVNLCLFMSCRDCYFFNVDASPSDWTVPHCRNFSGKGLHYFYDISLGLTKHYVVDVCNV